MSTDATSVGHAGGHATTAQARQAIRDLLTKLDVAEVETALDRLDDTAVRAFLADLQGAARGSINTSSGFAAV